jgi:hypothetical protein
MAQAIVTLLSLAALIFVVGLVGGTARVRWVPHINHMHKAEKVLCEVLGVLLLISGCVLIFYSVKPSGDPSPQPTPSGVSPSLGTGPVPSNTPSDSASPTNSITPPVSLTSSPTGPAAVPLTSLSPISTAGDLGQEEVKIQGTDYGATDVKSCVTAIAGGPLTDTWDVSGYSKLTVTLGIPSDDSPSEAGAAASVMFTSNGHSLIGAVTTSIGNVKTVTVPLKGVDQLTIGCNDEPGPTGGGNSVISVALANATVS